MSKKLVKATVFFTGANPASEGEKFEQVAIEDAGLAVFDDVRNGERVRFYPWHRIYLVIVGSDPDHPHAPAS